ncbi:MAG: glycosyltransferase, partial [Candidatus Poseidoniaceae archaeon]
DLDNVVAHGWISKEEKVRLLQESSLLILPSVYEGQPMVALEALACGTPVLASDSVHSLPSGIETASMRSKEDWLEKIERIQSDTTVQLPNAHRIEFVNEVLISIYSSTASMKSTSG